jgi:hypothetical protein
MSSNKQEFIIYDDGRKMIAGNVLTFETVEEAIKKINDEIKREVEDKIFNSDEFKSKYGEYLSYVQKDFKKVKQFINDFPGMFSNTAVLKRERIQMFNAIKRVYTQQFRKDKSATITRADIVGIGTAMVYEKVFLRFMHNETIPVNKPLQDALANLDWKRLQSAEFWS